MNGEAKHLMKIALDLWGMGYKEEAEFIINFIVGYEILNVLLEKKIADEIFQR